MSNQDFNPNSIQAKIATLIEQNVADKEERKEFQVSRGNKANFRWEGVKGLRRLGSGFCHATQAKDRGVLCVEEVMEGSGVPIAVASDSDGGVWICGRADSGLVNDEYTERESIASASVVPSWETGSRQDDYGDEFREVLEDLLYTEGRGFLQLMGGPEVRPCSPGRVSRTEDDTVDECLVGWTAQLSPCEGFSSYEDAENTYYHSE